MLCYHTTDCAYWESFQKIIVFSHSLHLSHFITASPLSNVIQQEVHYLWFRCLYDLAAHARKHLLPHTVLFNCCICMECSLRDMIGDQREFSSWYTSTLQACRNAARLERNFERELLPYFGHITSLHGWSVS